MAQGERLYKSANVQTGLNLAASVFDFQPVPQGSVYTGTIQILSAPSWAFHQAFVGGILWAEWTGFQPGPVIQAIGGEIIEVQSTGLVALTTYVAVLIGRIEPETDYVAVWPEASNNIINPTQPDQSFNVPNAVSTFTQAISVGVPGQVLAIQFDGIGGTATGLRLSAGAFPSTAYHTTYPYPPNVAGLLTPWWFVPVFDPVVSITVESILNNILGGNFFGVLNISVVPGPLFVPVLQSPIDITLPTNGIGRAVSVNASATANTPLLPEPATGTMYRTRGVTLTNGAGPGAAAALDLHGTFSGVQYRRFMIPTGPTDQFDMASWYVGQAVPRTDPAEGLVVNNLTNVAINVTLDYDILPFPQGITQLTAF